MTATSHTVHYEHVFLPQERRYPQYYQNTHRIYRFVTSRPRQNQILTLGPLDRHAQECHGRTPRFHKYPSFGGRN